MDTFNWKKDHYETHAFKTNPVAYTIVRHDWQLADSDIPRGSFPSEAILTTVSMKCSNDQEW